MPQSESQSQDNSQHEPNPTLLLLSLPAGALAGIDLLSFTTSSPRFRGISNLPTKPALHFAFAAANSGFAGRWGVWFSTASSSPSKSFSSGSSPSSGSPNTSSTSLTILKWDHSEESLVAEDDVAELLRWKANLGTLVRQGGLIGYTQQRKTEIPEGRRVVEIDGDADEGNLLNEETVDWAALTSYVTPEVLDRILGNGDDAYSDGDDANSKELDAAVRAGKYGQKVWRLSSMSSSLSDRDEVPGLRHGKAPRFNPITGDESIPSEPTHEDTSKPTSYPAPNNITTSRNKDDNDDDDDDKPLHLLPINLTQTWAPGTTGRARTTAALDRSWAAQSLLATHCSSEPLHFLGELQFTFVMLLILNNVSCAEQWLKLLRLLLTCVEAVRENPGFWVKLLETLGLQLRFVGASADAEVLALLDLVDETSEVKTLLGRFRRGLESLVSFPADHPTIESRGGFGAAETSSTDGEKTRGETRRRVQESDLGLLEVRKELDKLEALLTSERGWQFGGVFAKQGMLVLEDGEEVRMETTAFDEDDEEGEFAPVMVELTEEQAKFMGVERGDEVGDGASTLKNGKSKLEQEIMMQQKKLDDSDTDEEETDDGDNEDDEDLESSDGGEEVGDIEDMDTRF